MKICIIFHHTILFKILYHFQHYKFYLVMKCHTTGNCSGLNIIHKLLKHIENNLAQDA